LDFILDNLEARVLGALIEKDVTTPDYYPLSLNSLVNACNQKNNRDPLMELDEEAVRQSLESLQQKRLAGPARGADSRVTKYEHRVQEVFNFTRGETAVICVLLLRGPQTPGELRGRTERLFRFEEVSDVLATLQRLMQREPPLVKALPRQAGTKEVRYAHLFCGDIERETKIISPGASALSQAAECEERMQRLEEELASLRQRVSGLEKTVTEFRKQFE
jgi:uncharacterized protein YceH (UPF0502 family)